MEKVGPLEYKLALLMELSSIHNVFHMSMLRRYRSNPNHMIQEPETKIFEGLAYMDEPIKILDQKVNQLRNKEISIVNMKWSYHSPKEVTWEIEKLIKQKYLYLFLKIGE